MPTLADKLDMLQAQENAGRGVSCVRTVITYLRKDDIDAAKAVASNEWDKISSYPEIATMMRDAGLVEKNAYIT